VYAALVRLSQPWVMNVPLVDGHGNMGSADGDAPAQMRYTEARLTAAAETMLEDIHMDTVAWQENFDNSLQEPTVLPAMLPNLLVNGVSGIAVGMATNMPPHNLGEICAAITYLVENWDQRDEVSVDELMELVPGPDFPTGGLIFRYREEGGAVVDTIHQAYSSGRGRVIMQARMTTAETSSGRVNLVVSELPYGVRTNTLIEKIAREVRIGRISGVTDVRDESDYRGMHLVIETSRTVDPHQVLQDLLKYSQLRETFGVISLALVPDNGSVRPEYLSLRDLLSQYVTHRLDVITRRSQYELEKKQARRHVVEGLLQALDHLDEVIATIRRSPDGETARQNLVGSYGFSNVQAQAILDMPLRRLTDLEREKLQQEQLELGQRIAYLKDLLARESRRLEVILEETAALQERFGRPRRTTIVEREWTGTAAILLTADVVPPEDDQVIVRTPDTIRREAAARFSSRAGSELTKRPVTERQLQQMLVGPTEEVLLVTNRGRGWRAGVGFVPAEASWEDLRLPPGEKVVSVNRLVLREYLFLGTRQGQVKRTAVGDLTLMDRRWGTLIGLDSSDEVVFGGVVAEGAQLVYWTAQGQVLRVDGDEITSQQTDYARGVKGILLRPGDALLGGMAVPQAEACAAEWFVICVTETGYAHRTPLTEFPLQRRRSRGVRCLRPSVKAGRGVGGIAVTRGEKLDVYLVDNRRQRLKLEDIPITRRDSLGQQLVPADKPVDRVVMVM
jgi:DNA gyrase subunit A